jgi:HK97 family phage major capsid protein
MKENLIYNAIALAHAQKQGGTFLSEFEDVLKNAGEGLTVSKLLQLSGKDFLSRNNAMATTETAFGKEFVEERVLSSELIDRLKSSESVFVKAMLRSMGANEQAFPVKGVRIRMRAGTETVANPTGGAVAAQTKQAGTAELVLKAKKLIVTVYYSDELVEDSLVGIAAYVLGELQEAFERSLHEIILNGDEAIGANVNINIIDGNTSALPDGNSTDALLHDGARKVAIATASVVNATGALSVAHIRAARAKMGLKGVDPSNLVIVPDQDTYFSIMNLSEVETIEKFGDAATIKNGQLSAIDGIQIVNREELGRTTATGEISATAANNTKGQIVLIHMPSMNVGIRRGLTTETSRYAETQQTGITASARIAVKFDNTQNTLKPTAPAALIVNI